MFCLLVFPFCGNTETNRLAGEVRCVMGYHSCASGAGPVPGGVLWDHERGIGGSLVEVFFPWDCFDDERGIDWRFPPLLLRSVVSFSLVLLLYPSPPFLFSLFLLYPFLPRSSTSIFRLLFFPIFPSSVFPSTLPSFHLLRHHTFTTIITASGF